LELFKLSPSLLRLRTAGESKVKRSGNLRHIGKARGKQPGSNPPITDKEADDIEERSSPRTPVIYEIVRRLGDEEMDRPISSLWWSGVAAGLSISF
jgi:hypothetical protein